MDDTFRWVLIGVGGVTILGGIAVYWKDTSRWAPIFIVTLGVALCGVSNIKMSVSPTGGSLEVGPQLAEVSQASQDAMQKQGAMIQAVSDRVDQLTDAIGTLKTAVNTRPVDPAVAAPAPVALPQIDNLRATQPQFSAIVKENSDAKLRLFEANRSLTAAIARSAQMNPAAEQKK